MPRRRVRSVRPPEVSIRDPQDLPPSHLGVGGIRHPPPPPEHRATDYIAGQAAFERPPSNSLFNLVTEALRESDETLFNRLKEQLEGTPPSLSDELGPFLPYLVVRSFLGDRGMGFPPGPTTRPLPYSPDFLMTPDIWVSTVDVGDPGVTIPPDVGASTLPSNTIFYVYAHVWNLGRAPIGGVKVEFYKLDRVGCLGTDPVNPTLLGMARVNLPPRTSPGCHRLVKAMTSSTTAAHFQSTGDPFSILVRISGLGDPVADNSWKPENDRHVARRDFNPTLLALSDGLYDLNPDTGETSNFRAICTLNPGVCLVGFHGIAFSPDMTNLDGTCVLYGLRGGGNGDLFRIEPLSGNATLVGHLQVSGVSEGDIARDPMNGDLYGMYGPGFTLFRINPSNAMATPIGPIGGLGFPDILDPSAMTFDDEGNLYILDGQAGKLWQIDKSNAAIADSHDLQSSHPFTHSVAGMVYRRGTGGFLLATGHTGPGVQPSLYRLSPTGQIDLIAPIQPWVDISGLSLGF